MLLTHPLVAQSALEDVGFKVGGREMDGQLIKSIGYELVRYPAQHRLPANCSVMLQNVALLKRKALCIPFHMFRFCQKCEGQRMRWWPRVGEEVVAIADVVPRLVALIGSPLLETVFATDAMGEAHDYGGWGTEAFALVDGCNPREGARHLDHQ